MWSYAMKLQIFEINFEKPEMKDKVDANIFHCFKYLAPYKTYENYIKTQIDNYIYPGSITLLELTNDQVDMFIQKLVLADSAEEGDNLEIQIANLSKEVRNKIKAGQDLIIFLGAGDNPAKELVSVFQGKISKVKHTHNRPDIITQIWAHQAVLDLFTFSTKVSFSVPVGKTQTGRYITYFELIDSVLIQIFGSTITLNYEQSTPELKYYTVSAEPNAKYTVEKNTNIKMILNKIINQLANEHKAPLKYFFVSPTPGKYHLIIKADQSSTSTRIYSVDYESGLLSFEEESEKEGDKFTAESVLLPKAKPNDLIEIFPGWEFEKIQKGRFPFVLRIEKVEHRINTSFEATTTLTLTKPAL